MPIHQRDDCLAMNHVKSCLASQLARCPLGETAKPFFRRMSSPARLIYERAYCISPNLRAP
jgi:hypothetical protein